MQAAAPARLIAGGLPTERLVAQVLVAKYADHCPLYRQSQILARQGIVIDRSTLAFWVGYAAAEIKPLWRLMREDLLRSTKLFVDETTAPVLDPGRGRTKTGYFWVLARDDRPWRGRAPPAVVYSYAPGRGGGRDRATPGLLRRAADRCLCRLRQTRRSQAGRRPGDARILLGTLAAAVVRHRQVPASAIAAEVLQRIAELYQIKAEIRGEETDARRAVRQQKSKPLIEALKSWLEEMLRQVPSGSSIAQAIRYGFNQWDGLLRFLDDGRIEIDFNTVERSMRPVALNRKNALFAGSDEGAENWAMLASLIETCKLHGINPHAYLTDVLTKLVNNWPNRRLGELLPWAWPPKHPDPSSAVYCFQNFRSSTSARLNFQFFSGSTMRCRKRFRCSSFERWR